MWKNVALLLSQVHYSSERVINYDPNYQWWLSQCFCPVNINQASLGDLNLRPNERGEHFTTVLQHRWTFRCPVSWCRIANLFLRKFPNNQGNMFACSTLLAQLLTNVKIWNFRGFLFLKFISMYSGEPSALITTLSAAWASSSDVWRSYHCHYQTITVV